MTLVGMATAVDLDIDIPDSVSGSWLEDIRSAGSAAVLRDRLAQRFPVLADGRFQRMIILGAAGEGERLANIAAGAWDPGRCHRRR